MVTATWISLPPQRRPTSWANIKDLVCLLLLNLYGHPLAGILWDKYQESVLLKLDFEIVPSWECSYLHHTQRLFLSGYVDDYKMAGKKETIPQMWEPLKQCVDLDPPGPIHRNVYFGCSQRPLQRDLKMIASKRDMFQRVCHSSAYGKPTGTSGGDILKDKPVLHLLKLSLRERKRNPTYQMRILTQHFLQGGPHSISNMARSHAIPTKISGMSSRLSIFI